MRGSIGQRIPGLKSRPNRSFPLSLPASIPPGTRRYRCYDTSRNPGAQDVYLTIKQQFRDIAGHCARPDSLTNNHRRVLKEDLRNGTIVGPRFAGNQKNREPRTIERIGVDLCHQENVSRSEKANCAFSRQKGRQLPSALLTANTSYDRSCFKDAVAYP